MVTSGSSQRTSTINHGTANQHTISHIHARWGVPRHQDQDTRPNTLSAQELCSFAATGAAPAQSARV